MLTPRVRSREARSSFTPLSRRRQPLNQLNEIIAHVSGLADGVLAVAMHYIRN